MKDVCSYVIVYIRVGTPLLTIGFFFQWFVKLKVSEVVPGVSVSIWNLGRRCTSLHCAGASDCLPLAVSKGWNTAAVGRRRLLIVEPPGPGQRPSLGRGRSALFSASDTPPSLNRLLPPAHPGIVKKRAVDAPRKGASLFYGAANPRRVAAGPRSIVERTNTVAILEESRPPPWKLNSCKYFYFEDLLIL